MKNIVTVLLVIMTAGVLTANAQGKEDWKDRIMSEKIAFLTSEIGITPEEAQTFWPVYNQIQQEKDAAMREVFGCYKAMVEALEQKKSEKVIDKLLSEYLAATQKQKVIDAAAPEKFKQVLPVDKVARLYIAEEKFRRQQIHRLHSNHQKPSGRTR